MISSNEIHRSIIDANDIEEIHEEEISVGNVFRNLIKHPAQIITRWNWKSATLGAMIRALFYLAVYKASKENWVVTLTAVFVEFGFRFFTSGLSGALVQSFRKASPPWLATAIITISLPFFSHTVEFFAHYTQEAYFSNFLVASENKGRENTFPISVLFSVFSAMFSIYMMRSGVLLVGAGEDSNSLSKDLKKIPYLIGDFVTYLPNRLIDFIKSGNLLPPLGIFLMFGLTVGGILGIFRGKWSWAFNSALGAWGVLFVSTIIVAITWQFIPDRSED